MPGQVMRGFFGLLSDPRSLFYSDPSPWGFTPRNENAVDDGIADDFAGDGNADRAGQIFRASLSLFVLMLLPTASYGRIHVPA